MPSEVKPDLVTFKEGCALMCIATRTGYNWIQQGRFPIPVYKRGNRSLLSRDEINAYLVSLVATPTYGIREPRPKRGRPRSHLILP